MERFLAGAPPQAASGTLPRLTLVLGGARSGKSRHAEALVEADGRSPVYLATAEALDEEMRERIRHHRDRRGPGWETIEVPLDLADALRQHATERRVVLVDCLTLWLANVMAAGRPVGREVEILIEATARLGAPVVFVANEVGLGIVPEMPLGRAFRDEAGRLNQRLAALADRVVLVVAGLPLTIKDPPAP
jgi:adenosylcobinamide kinase/adenosylcobinamide-phosphate guanylyltransferase